VWDSALFELPLAVYACYGDPSLLLENREAMNRYMEFCASMAEDYALDFGLGDWCPPQGGAADHLLPTRVSDTATYYKLAGIAALASELAGAKADRLYFENLAAGIHDSFNRHFVNASTGEVTGNCQTGQAMALCLGLARGTVAEKAAERLTALIEKNDRRLDFGILGARYVFEALSRQGRGQLALDLILREGFPSYRHWLDTGATTMSETWNRGASDNHHMFSDVCRWFFRYVAGLGKPDFKKASIVFTPDFPAPLTHAEAYTETPAGKFSCAWKKEGGTIRVTCAAPAPFTVLLASPAGKPYHEDCREQSDGPGTTRTWIIRGA
jgi:alpha-L-rhamnosidase